LKEAGAPIVLKADGLAAGKGVVVAETMAIAEQALKDIMLDQKYGKAGAKVLLEKKLIGKEASLIAIIDGKDIAPFVLSQDYKRVNDHNEGPNTGGMGSISPTPVLSDERLAQCSKEIFLPVVEELQRRGIHYRGFLYAGLMIEENGDINVIEFNCRLGDPEAQSLKLRLDSDLVEVIEKTLQGKLSEVKMEFGKEFVTTVVLASKGYPEKVDDRYVVTGNLTEDDVSVVFHAGTYLNEQGEVITKGGRILSVTAIGDSAETARANAYNRIKDIHFSGMHYRNDIGE